MTQEKITRITCDICGNNNHEIGFTNIDICENCHPFIRKQKSTANGWGFVTGVLMGLAITFILYFISVKL